MTVAIERRRSKRAGWYVIAFFDDEGGSDHALKAWQILNDHSDGDYRVVRWFGLDESKVLTP